jgi:membrane protease YdiL (CAAX protease family)
MRPYGHHKSVGKLIYLAPEIPAFAAAVLVCLPWIRPRRLTWLGAALGYLLIDGALTLYAPRLPHAHWNWSGKAASLVLALILLVTLHAPARETALRWPACRLQWRWAVLGIVAACAFAGSVNFVFRDHTWPTTERLAYEATMPGLAEEFCWRGVLFLLLGRAYANPSGAAEFAPAAITSTLMFSLAHAVSMDHGSAHFTWLPFIYAAVFGAGLAFIRLRTQSLGACIVAHNMANICGDLVGVTAAFMAPKPGWPV